MVNAERVVTFSVNGAGSEVAVAKDRGLDEVIRLYRGLPER